MEPFWDLKIGKYVSLSNKIFVISLLGYMLVLAQTGIRNVIEEKK